MKAMIRGRLLRRSLGVAGRVDVDEAAQLLGYLVDAWDIPADEVHEVTVGNSIGIASALCENRRRWAVAHALGHRVLHPGNHAWLRARTLLATPFEREAEDFAYGLLVDAEEALAEGLATAGEFAEYFGVPEEMVRVQGRLC